ncbi:MAG TPA: TonB family protein [Polyangia bacterium]|nr:TonB family protein [Polyangia bacterium]
MSRRLAIRSFQFRSVAGVLCAWGLAAVWPSTVVAEPAPPESASPVAPALAVPPIPIDQVHPAYPAEALAGGARGDVAITAIVSPTGEVSGVELARGLAPALDRAAMDAATRWRFRPANRGGVPIASRVHLLFHFEPPVPGAASGPVGVPPPAATPPSTRQGGAPVATVEIAAPAPKPAEISPIDVTVRGRRQASSHGASDVEIDVGQLAAIAGQKPSDLLQLAPGIFIANEGGAGHADQVFLRGFDAEQGQAIEFTVDGVPINEVDNTDGHGYADTHFIIPELVKNLRVIEGPFSPQQGDFSEAGSADYQLGVVDRRLELSTSFGSFNTRRTLALWAPEHEREGTFAAAQLFQSDGYGTNRASTNASAMAEYEGDLGARGLWRLLGTAYGTHFQSAGVVRADDVASGRIGYYGSEDPGQGGDAERYTLSLDLQNPGETGLLAQQIFLTWRTLRIDEDFTGFLLDDQTYGQTYHPQRGDMIEQDYTAFTAGARGSDKLAGALLGRPQALEVGYYARYDHTTPEIQRLRYGTQIPYAIDESLTTDVVNLAVYADLDLRPTRWLTLRGGLRQEYFDYDVLNQCATAGEFIQNAPVNQTCAPFDNAGPRLPTERNTATGLATEPKVTALAQLAAPLTLSASFGRGAQSLDATYIAQNERAPFATITAGEGGLLFHHRYFPLDLSARAVGFYTHVDRDLIFNPLLGRLTQSTGTTRDGALVSVRATGKWFDELVSATYAHATFDQDGTLVPYVPSLIARSDSTVFGQLGRRRLLDHGFTGTAGFAVNFVGPRALPFSQTAASTLELDASASVRWSYLRVGLLAENLTDARYPLSEFFYASNFNSRSEPTLVPAEHFTAAPPFSLLATLSLLFDAESRR